MYMAVDIRIRAALVSANAAQTRYALQQQERPNVEAERGGAITFDAIVTQCQALQRQERRKVGAECGSTISSDAIVVQVYALH
jgi:hypothetical protein